MNRKTLLIVGGASVAALALLAWAFAPRPLAVEVARASAGPYEQSIVEDGKTRLRERFAVTAPLAGRLARITLREGDAVAAGAVVATLTPVLTPLLDERSQREQTARAEGAQAGVQRAEAGVERARVALEQARNELRRSEQLSSQGFIGPAKLDTDRLVLQAAQKELEAAVQARHIAEHERETTRAALLAVRSTGAGGGAAFPVRAPISGRVLRVHQASETTVALGTPLLEIGDTTQLEVLAELLTTDALQAPPGAPVRIERWGGPGVLEGRVRRVEPAAFTKVSALGVEEQRVNVLIDLSSPPSAWAALGDGYRVGVRIITLAKARVLKVPVSAVFPRAGGGHAVFALEGGRARLKAVELGGRNGSDAWVSAGLAEGAEVIVYPPAELADGARVKARSVPVK
ncbi:MAG: HlyD family efflux transporter periplasmic adaptor subunit [Burkholderiales bacterium]|nr:HlyD family efflux transporter periplasmic adaptor subunit [Burkholderiales bacterium]